MSKPITNDYLNQKLDYVKEAVDDVKETLKNDYVTQDDLKVVVNPLVNDVSILKRLVFGAVGVILLTVIGGVLALVVR